MTPLGPKAMVEELIHQIQRGLSPMVTSSPGLAKSSLARLVAEKLNLELIDIRLATYLPEDLNGYLNKVQADDGKWLAQFLPIDVFPLENAILPEGKQGWLIFLDELSSTSKQTQAAAYRLILDHEVGAKPLHPCVAIMGAGNHLTDKAVVNQMSTALVSRMPQLFLEANAQDWIEWAYLNDIDPRIIAYISYRNSHLMNFDPKKTGPYACPRTWEMLSDLIQGQDVNAHSLARIESVIGDTIAPQFIVFTQQYDKMPTFEEVINDPKTAMPDEMPTKFACAVMLSEKVTEETMSTVITFVKRFPIDIRFVFMRGVKTLNPNMQQTSTIFRKEVVELVKYLND